MTSKLDPAALPAWTKGPWEARKYVGDADNYFVRGPNDERVCGQGSGPVREANAVLIAAAPDLYEALNEVDHWLHSGEGDGRAIQRKVNAALARARGQQS